MIANLVKWFVGTEGFRFLITGALNTLLSLVVYWILLPWLSYPVAYTIGFMVGILSGFALNTFLVFRVPWSWLRLLAFPAVHAVNYATGMAVVWGAVTLLEVDARVAPVVAAICVVPLNFLMTRFVVKPGVHSGIRSNEQADP